MTTIETLDRFVTNVELVAEFEENWQELNRQWDVTSLSRALTEIVDFCKVHEMANATKKYSAITRFFHTWLRNLNDECVLTNSDFGDMYTL